jgi:hypothetical protein
MLEQKAIGEKSGFEIVEIWFFRKEPDVPFIDFSVCTVVGGESRDMN